MLLFLIDYELMMWQQPEYYWDGWYDNRNESNPVSDWLLKRHPYAMIAGASAWAAGFCTLIGLLPGRSALYVSLAITLGHSFGAGTWAYSYYGNEMALALTLFAAATCTVAFENWAANGMVVPAIRKWILFAALSACAPAAAVYFSYTPEMEAAEVRVVNNSGSACRIIVELDNFETMRKVAKGANAVIYTTVGGVTVKSVSVILGTKAAIPGRA